MAANTPPSSTNSALFEYKHVVLPSAATHIRLIELSCFPTAQSPSGGSYDAPLKCRMFSAPLDRPPPFVALSYTWGTNKEERHLHVSAGAHNTQGGAPTPSSAPSSGLLTITPSLSEALRHVRKAQQSDSVTLWVDQICIDQSNTLEKNDQVAAMGTIYGRAAEVLVWLGPGTPGSDDFIDRMATVGALAREQGLERYFEPAQRTDEEFWGFMSKVTADADDDKFETFLRGAAETLFGNGGSKREVAAQLRAWLGRPWFTRVWVLQEYSLVAKSPAFLCGDRTIEAELFSLAHTVLMMTFAGRRAVAPLPAQGQAEPAADRDGPVQLPAPEQMAEQMELMNASRDNSSVESLARLRRHCRSLTAGKNGGGGSYSLGELVQDLYRTDTPLMLATDPRDRIFALLSLCSDGAKLGISPDYAKSQTVDLVYTRAARAILTSDGGIRLFEMLTFPKTIVGHEDAAMRLPSWVPDFYHHTRSISASLATASRNQWLYTPTGAARKAEITPTPAGGDPRILTLKAILVDTISQTGEAWPGATPPGSKDADPALYLPFYTAVEQLCKIPPPTTTKPPRDATDLAHRVMLCDIAYQPNSLLRRATPADLAAMRKHRRGAYLIDLARRVLPAIDAQQAGHPAVRELYADAELAPRWWDAFLLGTGVCARLVRFWVARFYTPRSSLQRLVDSIKELLLRRDVADCSRRLDVMCGKRPFRTREGGLCGVGPRLVMPGDVVALLFGARTPYVLRPRGDAGVGCFEVVGEAYCHGIMDGEAAGGKVEEIHLV